MFSFMMCPDFTFDFDVEMLTFKILSGLYIWETVRCRKSILGKNISWEVKLCNHMMLL